MVYENGFDPVTNVTVRPTRTKNSRVYRIAICHGIAGLILAFYLLYQLGRINLLMKSLTNADTSKLNMHNVKLGFYTLSALFGLEFVVCVILLFGVMQASPKLYIPWFIYTPICRVATLCILNIAFIYLPFSTAYITFINIIGVLIIALAMYSVFLVYRNYKQLICSKTESMMGALV